jgi:hypothetical protein
LTSVTIPNSVTTIGEEAFSDCDGLTSVTIPNSVTAIGEGAFRFCSGLTAINVDAGNTQYTSEGGVLFNKDKTMLLLFLERKMGSYVIPNSVTTISGSAFYSCSGLTSVTIPNSVTAIGEWAFERCSGLTSVTIPNSVTAIGEGGFLRLLRLDLRYHRQFGNSYWRGGFFQLQRLDYHYQLEHYAAKHRRLCFWLLRYYKYRHVKGTGRLGGCLQKRQWLEQF